MKHMNTKYICEQFHEVHGWLSWVDGDVNMKKAFEKLDENESIQWVTQTQDVEVPVCENLMELVVGDEIIMLIW